MGDDHHHHFISDINVTKTISPTEPNSTSSNNSTIIWYDKLNNTISKTMVGKYFNLESRKTNFTTELRAATSTFLTMVYIITVNASILSESGGPCSSSDCSSSNDPSCVIKQNPGYDLCVERVKSDLIVATSITAMIGSISMGVIANLPFGLAPGMGPNVYFAYNLVGFHGLGGVMSYETGMAVVFVEGLTFMVISVIGLRLKLARLIPKAVRLGCGAGLGLFICFTGLQTNLGLGVVGPDKSTLVTLTGCRVTDPDSGVCIEGKMENPRLWLGMIGFVIICYSSMMKNSFVKGSMILGIMFVTFISWVRDSKVTFFPNNSIGDARYEYFTKVVDFHLIKSTAGAISFEGFNRSEVWVALMTLLYVDVVATTGTLYTMAEMGGFITTTNGNDDGSGDGGSSSTEGFKGEYAAYIVDAGSTVIGSLLGVTPTATYVESTAGIKEGGRSGLTAVIIGFYFMLSLFFTPVMVSVPPWAIGPALVMIGVMMMKVVKDIEWGEVKEAVPAFITMVIMPLTYSISNGIIGGIGFYVVLSGYDYGVRLIKMRRKMVREENQVSATGGMDSVNVV